MAKASSVKKSRKSAPTIPVKTVGKLDNPGLPALASMNFKVPEEFHREFKTYAVQHGKTMLELLQEGFQLIKGQHG